MGRVALTGAGSFLGALVLRRLVARGHDLVVCDLTPPPAALGVRHRTIDLTEPAAGEALLQVFREEGVVTVAHFAFFTNPRRDTSYAHELESIGTLSLLAAAAAAGVGRVLMRSFTALYGARGQNPNFLGEDARLSPNPSLAWARDKLEAEQHASAFAKRYPEMALAVLRFAPLFGPGVANFYTRVFDKRVVPTLMGYDPLVQLLHPDEALRATERALEVGARGPFNIVPAAAIPLRAALHLAAKIPMPVPHPLGYLASDALWNTGLGEAPGAFLDYVRYLFVADGARAERELGFRSTWSSRAALLAYLEYRHPSRVAAAAAAAPR